MANQKPLILSTAGQIQKIQSGNLIDPVALGTGSASSSTYLRGDGTWSTPAGGGASALSSITAAIAANSISSGDHAQTWNWSLTSATKSALTISENSASTSGGSNQILLDVGTVASSTASPLRVSALGTEAFRVNVDGVVSTGGSFVVNGTTDSSSVGTGSVVISGGLSIVKNTYSSGTLTLNGNISTGSKVATSGDNTTDTSSLTNFRIGGTIKGGASTTSASNVNTICIVDPSVDWTSYYHEIKYPIITGTHNITYAYGQFIRMDMDASALGGTIGNWTGVSVQPPSYNAAATKLLTTYTGIGIADYTQGAGQASAPTNVYGLSINISTGTGRYGLYSVGSAANHMAGALLMSTTTSVPSQNASASNFQPKVQASGTTLAESSVAVNNFSAANTVCGVFHFNKSDSGTTGTNTAVVDTEWLGEVVYAGADGTNYPRAASIRGVVSGTVSTGIVPGGLNFLTADAAGVMQPAISIDSTQAVALHHNVSIYGTSLVLPAATCGLEMGAANTVNTPYIDFHSGATLVDYDVRIIASGGDGTDGHGLLTVQASNFAISGALGVNGGDYGTAGKVLTSAGSASPATWETPIKSYTATIGDGTNTTITVTHSLNKTGIVVSVREVSSGYFVYPDIKYTSTNAIDVEFVTAPSTNQYFVTVIG